MLEHAKRGLSGSQRRQLHSWGRGMRRGRWDAPVARPGGANRRLQVSCSLKVPPRLASLLLSSGGGIALAARRATPPSFIAARAHAAGEKEHPPNAFTRAPTHNSALSALQALSVTIIPSSNPLTYSGDAGELYFPRRRARKEHQGEIIGGLFASLGLWWANLSGWHRWHLQGARLVQ